MSYLTKETLSDKAIVAEISNLASGLKGINYLNTFEPRKHLIRTEEDKRKYISQRVEGARHLATGTTKAMVQKTLKICSAGSIYKNTVIFCSDMMSEGVNLQGASSLILLDLPSVVRLVEQRIGRIDRMDTNHEVIDILWPNDSEEFSLRGDKRLINTSVFVNSTIGGNYQIPSELMDRHFENVESIEAIQQELEEKRGEKGWEGSRNFFSPIELLKERFVPEDLYQLMKDVKSSIKVRVSFYESKKDWCFIATKGTIKESPKWILLEPDFDPTFDFIEVAQKLNQYLPLVEKDRLKWQQGKLDAYLEVFRGQEKLLLPVKKRRALEVAQHILSQKLSKEKDLKIRRLIEDNLSLFTSSIKVEMVDFYSLSEMWLWILQPHINKMKDLPKNRRKALNLNSLKDEWKRIHLDEVALQDILDNCTKTETIDSKIAACIIGVSSSH